MVALTRGVMGAQADTAHLQGRLPLLDVFHLLESLAKICVHACCDDDGAPVTVVHRGAHEKQAAVAVCGHLLVAPRALGAAVCHGYSPDAKRKAEAGAKRA